MIIKSTGVLVIKNGWDQAKMYTIYVSLFRGSKFLVTEYKKPLHFILSRMKGGREEERAVRHS